MGEIEEANESSFVVERTPSSKLSYRKYRSGRRMSQEDESEFSRVASGTGALSSSSRSSSRASSASSTNSNRKARANSGSRSPGPERQHPRNVDATTSHERDREHHQRSTCSSGSLLYAHVISVSRTQSHEGISRTESSASRNRKLGEGHDVAGTTLLISALASTVRILALASTAVVLVLVAFAYMHIS